MNVLVTGTSGRVGRAIYLKLMRQHAVVGVDLNPSSTADIVGDLRAPEILERAFGWGGRDCAHGGVACASRWGRL